MTTPDLDIGARDGANVWLEKGALKSGTTERFLFSSSRAFDDEKVGEV